MVLIDSSHLNSRAVRRRDVGYPMLCDARNVIECLAEQHWRRTTPPDRDCTSASFAK
jgi:hypothetical protein